MGECFDFHLAAGVAKEVVGLDEFVDLTDFGE